MSPDAGDNPLANALRLLRGPVPDALQQLPLPIWITDTNGHVRWMNVAAKSLFGRRVGTHFTRFIAADAVGDARELFARKDPRCARQDGSADNP